MRIKVWVFRLWAVLTLLLAAATVAWSIGIVPFWYDNGSTILVARDLQARNDLVELLRPWRGLPQYRLDTAFAKRAFYADGLIINTTDAIGLKKMGNPAGGLAMVTDHPLNDATRVAEALKARGYSATILGTEVEPDVEEGRIYFIRTNILKGAVLAFRRHKFGMGRQPPPW